MRYFWKNWSFLISIFIIIGLVFIYRQVIFNGKILFPSNFLAQFYSPWRTEKFPDWEAGIPHKPIGDDQIRLFYPERTFTNDMLAKKTIPLWNPYIFAGTPFLADFQSAIFYPLNILYLFLPQIYAWEILQFIQPIMATFFMYLFLSLFRLNKMAIWLGSISFGFSGFIIVWSQENVVGQVALWLPLALFGIEGYLKTKKLSYYYLSIISLTCAFLAGFFQIAFYIFVFSFFYSLFRIRNLKLPFLNYALRTIGIYFFSLCLSGIQLLPSIEAFLESPRSTSSAWYLFEGYLLPITHVFNALVPDVFGNPGAYNFFGRGFYREAVLYAGLVPLVFAAYAGFKAKKNPIIGFFTAAAFLTFFLTVDSSFTRWLFQLPLPIIPTFLPSRILFLTTFSISTLSAFGLSIFITQKEKKDSRLMLIISSVFYVGILLIGVFGLLLLNYGNTAFFQQLNDYIIRNGSHPERKDIYVLLKNLLLPFIMLSILFVVLLFKKVSNLSLFGIIILALFGQFYFFNKYLVTGERQFLYPKNPVISFLQSKNSLDRFLTLREPMEENISTYAKIYSAEGANPVFPRRYGELLFALKNNGKVSTNIPRIEARLGELGDKENPFEDNRRMRLMSLLGIKYVLYFDNNPKNNVTNKYPQNIFHPVWRDNNWYGLEYLNAFSRVFLVNNIYIENDPQKILDLIFDPKINLLNTIILEEKPKELNRLGKFINLPKLSSESFTNIISYEPQEVIIQAQNNSPQILFLSDNYYPGWKAYIDDNETKIFRANYTFRSIYLPKGNHKVIFKYEPISFKIGSIVSLLTVVLLLTIFVFKKIKTLPYIL